MHGNGFAESTHAAIFDIDDPARLHFDRRQRVAAVADRFVEADRRVQPLLKQGMEIKIVRPERLLDHQQVKVVKADQMLKIIHPVSGIGIAAQRDVRPAFPHRLEYMPVPTRLALQLNALVAGVHFLLNLRQLLFKRRLNPDRDSARDHFLRTAQQVGQRYAAHLRLRIPDGVFERSLCHAMAADLAEDARTLATVLRIGVRQRRCQFLHGDQPRCVNRFFTEIGMLTGYTLTPAGKSLGLDLDQHDAAFRRSTETGLEWRHQRHSYFAKNNSVYYNASVSIVWGTSSLAMVPVRKFRCLPRPS